MKDISNVPTKSGFNFRFIDKFDVSKIFEYLKNYEWTNVPETTPYYPFYKDSQYIPIIDINYSNIQGNLPIGYSTNVENKKSIESIVDRITKKYNGRIIRSFFVKLPSLQRTLPIKEGFLFTRISLRLYVIIDTDNLSFFNVNNETKHLDTGECWEINPNLLNSTWNVGTKDLIYLVLDLMPEEYF